MSQLGGNPRGCTFHESAIARNLGPVPNGVEQAIGEWEAPPNLYKHFRDPSYDRAGNLLIDPNTGLPWDCVPDSIGAPTVSCAMAIQLSQGAPAQQPSATQIANNGVQTDGQGTDWSEAKLRVLYGSGAGDFNTFDCDVRNGTPFPLIARSARFYLLYPIVANPYGQPFVESYVQPRIDVSIAVGIGVLGESGGRPPRLSQKVGLLDGEGSVVGPFAIPKMATSIIYASTDAGAAPILTQLVAPVAGAAALAVNVLSKLEYQSVPVLNGARGFSIVGGAAGNTFVTVIFLLSPA